MLRSVDTLLGPSEFAGEFAGGTFTHMFLDVNDYHRYHFPVSGTIREVLVIPGDDAIGGRTVCQLPVGDYADDRRRGL